MSMCLVQLAICVRRVCRGDPCTLRNRALALQRGYPGRAPDTLSWATSATRVREAGRFVLSQLERCSLRTRTISPERTALPTDARTAMCPRASFVPCCRASGSVYVVFATAPWGDFLGARRSEWRRVSTAPGLSDPSALGLFAEPTRRHTRCTYRTAFDHPSLEPIDADNPRRP